jgi:hypothetical protein
MRINIHRCPPDAYITAVRIRTYLDEAKLLSYGKKVAVMRQRMGDIGDAVAPCQGGKDA